MQRVVAAELSGSVAVYSTTDILAVCEVSATTLHDVEEVGLKELHSGELSSAVEGQQEKQGRGGIVTIHLGRLVEIPRSSRSHQMADSQGFC